MKLKKFIPTISRIVLSLVLTSVGLYTFYNTDLYGEHFYRLIDHFIIEIRMWLWGEPDSRFIHSETISFLIPILVIGSLVVIYLKKSKDDPREKSAGRLTGLIYILVLFTVLPFSLYPSLRRLFEGWIGARFSFLFALFSLSVVLTLHLVIKYLSIHENFKNDLLERGAEEEELMTLDLSWRIYIFTIGSVSFAVVFFLYYLSILWDEIMDVTRLSPSIQVFLMTLILSVSLVMIYLYLDYSLLEKNDED